jgi:hypothetical protein
VEAGGTTAHHAHDASHCAACVARGLLWGSDVTPRALVDALRATIVAHSIRDTAFDSLREFTSRSRAPPIRLA